MKMASEHANKRFHYISLSLISWHTRPRPIGLVISFTSDVRPINKNALLQRYRVAGQKNKNTLHGAWWVTKFASLLSLYLATTFSHNFLSYSFPTSELSITLVRNCTLHASYLPFPLAACYYRVWCIIWKNCCFRRNLPSIILCILM